MYFALFTVSCACTAALYLQDVLLVRCLNGRHEDVFCIRIVDEKHSVAKQTAG